MSNLELVLASGSPRRRELLAQLGLKFTVIPSHVDEEEIVARAQSGHPEEIVTLLAEAKAREVARSIEADSLVIGADTIVWLDNAALNKPKDAEDAVRMLRSLSGRTHRVYTGLAIVPVGGPSAPIMADQGRSPSAPMMGDLKLLFLPAGNGALQPSITGFAMSEVEFYPISESQAREYVATGEPMDKAGSYGIQEIGAKLVKSVRGDYYNVVGLPIARLRELILPLYPDFPTAPEAPMMPILRL